jgi:predicted nucleotidyltransferase
MGIENLNSQDMDNADAVNIAQRYAVAVNEKFNYIKIILFGSYAKGNYHDDSDIDIAVVLKDYRDLINMQLELMRLRRKIDSRIEPHPFRVSDFAAANPMVNEILKYGIEIQS